MIKVLKSIKLIDFYFILLTIFYILGMIAIGSQAAIITFGVLAFVNIVYFVFSLKSRIKLNDYIIKEKLAAFKLENNMLEVVFEEIKSGKFKDLNQFKAYVGENNIISILEKFEGKKRFIQNLIINNYGNKTSEIDVIMIHTSGIYVIESKNWYGNIKGVEDEENWVCDYGNKKIEFYNPIMQNNTHINELKNLLADSRFNTFKSFIVFTNRVIKLDYRYTTKKAWIHVVRQSDLLERVVKQSKYSENLLTVNEVDRIADSLMEYKDSFPKNIKIHNSKFTD